MHITPSNVDMSEESTFVGGYIAPTLAVAFTILWVLMQYWLIGWRGRSWEFGAVPYVPGESAFVADYAPSIVEGKKQVVLPSNTGGGTYAPR